MQKLPRSLQQSPPLLRGVASGRLTTVDGLAEQRTLTLPGLHGFADAVQAVIAIGAGFAFTAPGYRRLAARGRSRCSASTLGVHTADDPVVPVWEDVLFLTALVALCGFAERAVGTEVAGWGVVTICVVTGLQTTRSGKLAMRRGLLRLLGTFVGAAGAAIAGKSRICMVLWVAVLVFLKRRVVRPADSYSCVVAAFTFVVVGMVNLSSAEIQARGIRRLSGIALGTASLFSGLAARAILHALASSLLGLRRRTKNANQQQ